MKKKKSPSQREELLKGLAQLQIGYVQKLKKSPIKSAWTSLKGVGHLENCPSYVEALLSIHLYQYYKDVLMEPISWLPMINSDKKKHISAIHENFHKSEFMQEAFRTSLIWMLYDEKQFQQAKLLVYEFLQSYPNNRIYSQILGDLHFRIGNLDSAAAIYEKSKNQYFTLTRSPQEKNSKILPIRYLSAVGNLVRIYHKMDNLQKYHENLEIWQNQTTPALKSWLPASLVKDLEKFPLE